MSNNGNIFVTSTGGNHERPFFLPWNRRLRHLQGISVRNLSIDSTRNHHRGKTSTDEDVEYSLKSPTKLLAQSEARSLHQTRSFTNLKSPDNGSNISLQKRSSVPNGQAIHPNGRPSFGRMRRRSTLHWTGASPETRQKKLEDVTRERMAEAWFSLHIAGTSEPVYISEVVGKSVNPSFVCFDLNIYGPQVARSDDVQLKLWAKTDKHDSFVLLIDLDVCLRSLQFVGKSLDNFHQPLPSNCILFHFEDGIYTSFTDMPVEEQPLNLLSMGVAKAGITRPERTASYNALMQLASVDDCVQDALATRAKLEEQINDLLSCNKERLEAIDKNKRAQEAVSAVHQATISEQRQLRLLRRRRDDILASLKLRRESIQSGQDIQTKNESAIHDLQTTIQETDTRLEETSTDSSGQIRRVCEDLALIYPLEPIKNRPLHFSIRNLYLPNSVFDDTNRDEIAAALGFTATITHMLSLYLSTPLLYPIFPNSSTSTIEDPISVAITERTFPLYPTNVAYKFEYGVFLLNKNLEFLMSKCGLRMLDIRHTLPNLKYLLYVLTAGTGELPARKAGGVRGLIMGRVTPTISRRGSEDSEHSTVSNPKLPDGQVRSGSLQVQPVQVNGKEKVVDPDISGRVVPPPPLHALSYTTPVNRVLKLMPPASDDLDGFGEDWVHLQFDLELTEPTPPTHSTPQQPRLGTAHLNHQVTSDYSPTAMITSSQRFGAEVGVESTSPYETVDIETITKQEATPPREGTHRRGYQACDPCRKRKVKCDLGSVDNPHDPPCMRCRREHKECIFSATRRKRRKSQEADDISDDGGPGRDKKRLTVTTGHDVQDGAGAYSYPYSSSPYQQSGSLGTQWSTQVQPSLTSQARPSNGYEQKMSPRPPPTITSPRTNMRNTKTNEHMLNKEAANILHPSIATSHEALHLLSVAAGQTEEANRQSQVLPTHLRSPPTNLATPGSSGNSYHHRALSNNLASGEQMSNEAATFDMASGQSFDPAEEKNYQEAFQMWSRMRLVKDGWFTPSEAMAYIDYFYEHLAPMTPVVINDYRAPAMHTCLVTDEPILAITILTIASRHMKLSGLGATSRAYQIHDVLWQNLRGMVQRLVWGQEQFGGGFRDGGAVKTRESRTGQVTWKGSLRTLGTIEALLLLTDWHPRALHFPPGDNENRLLDADFPTTKDAAKQEADGWELSDSGKVAFSSWLEPAWRSDRMSWMLLGAAVTLSFELAVFDREHYNCKDHHGPESECARKHRVRRMVLVYVSQTSGRLGFTPMLPFENWRTDHVFEETNKAHRHGPADPTDLMQECWMGIAGLMYKANEEIFLSKQYTRDLTSRGQYITAIAKFKPMLQEWKANFERVRKQFDPVMQHLLSMEHDYARLYINSLGLQKVVESWINISNEAASSANNSGNAGQGFGAASAASGVVTFSVLLDIWRPNKEYIDEVSDAAQSILKAVMEGLVPGGHLTHASVRSYFRILSGLMFTLKRFSFGASEQEVRESLTLLDSITDHLTRSVVDDVHLSARTAELVKMLSSHLRAKFIRLQAPVNGSAGSSRENSRHQTPHAGQQDQTTPPQEFVNHQQSQTGLNNNQFVFPSHHHNPQELPRLHDPLAGIQPQSMSDLSNITYMPPMNYNLYMAGNDSVEQNPSSSDFVGPGVDGLGDWFALPLDNFFSTDPAQAPVNQGFGGIGPTVGSKDMLEFITNEQYDHWDGGNGFTGAGVGMGRSNGGGYQHQG